MKAKISYKKELEDIRAVTSQLQIKAEDGFQPVLGEIGKTVVKAVRRVVPVSDRTYYYRRGRREPIVHFVDDVIYRVWRSKGRYALRYVSIGGGEKTGGLWHIVNDGHIAQDGTWVQGALFIERAQALALRDVDRLVDDFLRGVVED